MHRPHGENPTSQGFQHAASFRVGDCRAFNRDQTNDLLEIVLHAVINFAKEHIPLSERLDCKVMGFALFCDVHTSSEVARELGVLVVRGPVLQ